MKKEVLSAVNFLVDLLRSSTNTSLSEEQLLKFRKHAYECLWQHYQNHWFPESPQKGSGYRCIRINGKMDPLIARAGELVGLAAGALRALFPSELTMWVDPSEVAYRIGENGSICNLYVQMCSNTSSKSPAEVKRIQENSPVKAAPPKHQPPSSPQLTVEQLKQQQQHQQQQQQQQLHIQQYTPSKIQQQQYHSPPRSPVFNSRPQHLTVQQQQQQLAMFLMSSHHQNHTAPASNCKDSLLRNFDSQSRNMERLYVSS
ncbi:Protein BTG1 [Armadillidium vulgare]|nr:Protein BTG1 [Armadillidium vulgare]